MPKFGHLSIARLEECDERLQLICYKAIQIMDFTILEGYRDEETQNRLHAEGKSQLQFPNSKHNTSPSLAIDIAPYPIDWEDKERFNRLAGLMLGIAAENNIKLVWGGTWGGLDDDYGRFVDMPHFQIAED